MLADLAECGSSVDERNCRESVGVVINLALMMCSILEVRVHRPLAVTRRKTCWQMYA